METVRIFISICLAEGHHFQVSKEKLCANGKTASGKNRKQGKRNHCKSKQSSWLQKPKSIFLKLYQNDNRETIGILQD